MQTVLTHPCSHLPGVGPTLGLKLAKCGIVTIQDLLFHLPFRYQDRTRITPISDLRKNDWCVIAGTVCKTNITSGKRRMLHCYVEDKSGIIKLRFFHFTAQQVKAMNSGASIQAFGEVREFSNTLEIVHPEYQLLDEGEVCSVEETLTPIYSTTQGLSQNRLRQFIKTAFKVYKDTLIELEWMSKEQLKAYSFMPMYDALILLHNPPPDTSSASLLAGTHNAQQRLIFDELLAHRLSMQFARQTRLTLKAPKFTEALTLKQQFLSNLPFELTKAQLRVSEEISQDMLEDKPMLRLVQGDVGAGKTINAALAALQAVASGYQAAFMAPTELLSEQHFANLNRWLSPLNIRIKKLSGNMKAREKREALESIANLDCDLLVGTHALFQEQVSFAKLGLIIIDEQHRFGVEQRLSLQQKGTIDNEVPHQLLMTATPIPRTLAMTHFAHLDISILDELPKGRIPIITSVLNQEKRQPLIERLQLAIAQGRQAYWVCTLIDESEKLQCMAATETALALQAQLPNIKVGLVHGRMKTLEKERVMAAFKAGELELLVATTVIEVGVDVPKASLMIIENAERLGMTQLHQLRGRVGRGVTQSHCLLLYQSPISALGAERLSVLRETNDGFVIAEKDLTLRGGGEILGTKQTGYRTFKIALPHRDKELIAKLPELAKEMVSKNQKLAKTIATRWLGEFETFLQG